MTVIWHILEVVGGGLLFAFITSLFYAVNTDPADTNGIVIFSVFMFFLGMILVRMYSHF